MARAHCVNNKQVGTHRDPWNKWQEYNVYNTRSSQVGGQPEPKDFL